MYAMTNVPLDWHAASDCMHDQNSHPSVLAYLYLAQASIIVSLVRRALHSSQA